MYSKKQNKKNVHVLTHIETTTHPGLVFERLSSKSQLCGGGAGVKGSRGGLQ